MEFCLRLSFVELCWHVLGSCFVSSPSSDSFSMKTSSSSSSLFVVLKLCIAIFSSSSCLWFSWKAIAVLNPLQGVLFWTEYCAARTDLPDTEWVYSAEGGEGMMCFQSAKVVWISQDTRRPPTWVITTYNNCSPWGYRRFIHTLASKRFTLLHPI